MQQKNKRLYRAKETRYSPIYMTVRKLHQLPIIAATHKLATT